MLTGDFDKTPRQLSTCHVIEGSGGALLIQIIPCLIQKAPCPMAQIAGCVVDSILFWLYISQQSRRDGGRPLMSFKFHPLEVVSRYRDPQL